MDPTSYLLEICNEVCRWGRSALFSWRRGFAAAKGGCWKEESKESAASSGFHVVFDEIGGLSAKSRIIDGVFVNDANSADSRQTLRTSVLVVRLFGWLQV